MNMYAPKYNDVQALFSDLIHKHGRNIVAMKTPYPATVMDLPLERSLNIMPAIAKQVLIHIARSAMSGDLSSMYSISRMYVVGLGLPRSAEKAYSWGQFSLVEQGTIPFTRACKHLKDDIRALPYAFAYPAVIDDIYDSMVPLYEEVTFDNLASVLEKNKNYYITPMYAGVRLFLIYRVDRKSKSCYLYDARAGGQYGDRLSLDVVQHLRIPFVFGQNNNKSTIPDYLSRMEDHMTGPVNYLTVVGTLTVNPYKKDLVKAAMPDIKNASALFDRLVESAAETRMPYKDTHAFIELTEKISRLDAKIKAMQDGSYISTIKENFNSASRAFYRAKRKGDKDAMANAKARAQGCRAERDRARNPNFLPLLLGRLSDMNKQLTEVAKENDRLREIHAIRYPENAFDFMATDIYYGDESTDIPLPVGPNIYQHLSSLGFQSFTSPLFEYCYNAVSTHVGSKRKACDFIKGRFEEFSKSGDYRTVGVIIRSSNTVNLKEYDKVSFLCYF